MKRSVVGALLVFVVLLGFGIFCWLGRQPIVSAGQIAPASSLFYSELSHFQETVKRFPETALSQILNEPSFQRFTRRPISKLPPGFQKALDSFLRLRCDQVFVCSGAAHGPNWIVGFQTSTDRTTARKEVESIAFNILGRSVRDLDLRNLNEPGGPQGLWMLRSGGWLLISPSAKALQEAEQNASSGLAGIQSDPLFRLCRAAVPNTQDIVSFIRGGPKLDLSEGFPWALPKDQRDGDIKAILCATKIEGARLRDTVFTCRDIPAAPTPFEPRGLDLSGPRTVAIFTSRVGLSELWQITDHFSQFSQLAETVHDYLGQVRSFGIDPRDLDNFVSAATIIFDRDERTDAVTGCLALSVIQPEKFKLLIDQIAAQRFPDSFVPTQIGGVFAYAGKSNPNASIVFGLVGREFLVASNASVFGEVLKRMESKGRSLQSNEGFKGVAKLVSEPTDLFMYVDTKTAFERVYDSVRPMLVFGAAFVPALGEYLDSSAMPATAELSRHLTPIVLSRHRVPNGVLDESIGPVTAYQAFALGIGTTVALGLVQRN